MRIISGTARGRTLAAPKGLHTRPTQDYVRESLFNIIQRDVPGAVVLDLFAGSGALALEALSRGAEYAVMADKAWQAAECIRRNIASLGVDEQALLIHADWQKTMETRFDKRFDLVFLDPPYRLIQYKEMTDKLMDRDLLADDALIVIEHLKDVPMSLSPVFILQDQRSYGDTILHFYRFHAGGHAHEI